MKTGHMKNALVVVYIHMEFWNFFCLKIPESRETYVRTIYRQKRTIENNSVLYYCEVPEA